MILAQTLRKSGKKNKEGQLTKCVSTTNPLRRMETFQGSFSVMIVSQFFFFYLFRIMWFSEQKKWALWKPQKRTQLLFKEQEKDGG